MKKASMQMSINTIIVLMLALAMLGVGFYFINDVLKGQIKETTKITDSVKESIKSQLIDSGQKLVLQGLTEGSLIIPKGKEGTLTIGISNQGNSDAKYYIYLQQISCKTSTGEDCTDYSKAFFAPTINIPFSDFGFLNIEFSAPRNSQKEIWKVFVIDCTSATNCLQESVGTSEPTSNIYASQSFFIKVK